MDGHGDLLRGILGDIDGFLTGIFDDLGRLGVDVSSCELDHLCYRVASSSGYENKKTALLGVGTLLTESMVGGRPISTFRLESPVRFRERSIWLVELPSPKSGSAYSDGLEHVEFVIAESFPAFLARYSGLDWDTEGMNKPINGEVRLRLGDRSVKFHHASLAEVIAFEQRARD